VQQGDLSKLLEINAIYMKYLISKLTPFPPEDFALAGRE
jgi:hypothetical protein